MDVMTVRGLRKVYPAFRLADVSFALREGTITGFIGRNGAGKTTTLKAALGLIRPDAGEVSFFGMDWAGHERAIKANIGYVSGGARFYPSRRLSTITAAARPFYPDWDEAAYRGCLRRFGLDERKTPAQLSDGMKVKYALTLALTHHAKLLILDEPTSGLDPVSRDELLELLLTLRAEGATILFSTHIMADLERCADELIYLRRGTVLGQDSLAGFTAAHRDVVEAEGRPGRTPLETIMLHLEKEGDSTCAAC